MAMSLKDRKRIREAMRLLYEHDGTGNPYAINEAADMSISSLSELEKFIKSKSLVYLKTEDTEANSIRNHEKEDIMVSLMFLQTKQHTFLREKAGNFVRFGFKFKDNDIQCTVSPLVDVSPNEFVSIPAKQKTDNGKDTQNNAMTAEYIASQCNASRIYNAYEPRATQEIRKLFAPVYHMFTGPNIMHRESNKPNDTLYVMYDNLRKKHMYVYNPSFVLLCAIDEWMLNQDAYKSLESCYIYNLAFLITHEMLHIIHHNTQGGGGFGDTYIDAGDHTTANIVQDSYINCKIGRRYLQFPGVNLDASGLAPMPRVGIGSKLTLRTLHNKGLKRFENAGELGEKIATAMSRVIKNTESSWSIKPPKGNVSRDMTLFEGTDTFVNIDVAATFGLIRDGSSGAYQLCINEILKTISDSTFKNGQEPMSDSEKIDDLDVLPDGTLVMIKYLRELGYTHNYDPKDKTYEVTEAVPDGFRTETAPDGSVVNYTKYKDSGQSLGRYKRTDIRPYSEDEGSFTPKSQNDGKRPGLSQGEIDKAHNNQPQPPQPPQQGQQGQKGGKPPKSIGVGDVVWVHQLKKFGKVKAILPNGRIQLDEVVETQAKVIDDSDNH